MFSLAIALFTLASIGCAAAPTLAVLTVFRVLQGVGGAMMVPVGRLIVLRVTAKVDLIKAIAYLTWPALVAPVLAPPLGGLISTYTSWRWIFLINVPLGMVGLVSPGGWCRTSGHRAAPAGLAGVPAHRVRGGRAGDRPGADRQRPAGLGVRVIALGSGRADHRRRHRLPADAPTAPLLDLRILRIAQPAAPRVAGGTVFRLVISAIPFLLPLFFQLGFGWTRRAGRPGSSIALFLGNLASSRSPRR